MFTENPWGARPRGRARVRRTGAAGAFARRWPRRWRRRCWAGVRRLKICFLIGFTVWGVRGFGCRAESFARFLSWCFGPVPRGCLVQREGPRPLRRKSCIWVFFCFFFVFLALSGGVILNKLSFSVEDGGNNHSVPPSLILFEVINRILLVESTNQ